MRVRPWLAVTLLATFSVWPRVAATQETSITVIENVRVLTMTDAGVLERQTVTVENDRIVSLTQGGAEAPSGARVIDGRGMTLLPGLADMHAHYNWPELGTLFLAHGVTTVRQTRWMPVGLTNDALAKAGVLAGPHVYQSGPLMDGENTPYPFSLIVTSPAEARGAVAAQALTGISAIKLYDGLDSQTFAAAVETAKKFDMQVWAHVPDSLTYADMIALGVDSIEHLWHAQYSLMDAPHDTALPRLVRTFSGWNRVDDARMADLALRTAEAGLWNVPTLTIYTQLFEYAVSADEFLSRPETKYLPPGVVQAWRAMAAEAVPLADMNRQGRPGRERWVKALYDAGAGLLVGTDTPVGFLIPGRSLHEELDNLSKAGIPNDALLRMATVEAARFLAKAGVPNVVLEPLTAAETEPFDEFGVVAAGARADLILVEGDPLSDLDVLRRPTYVMVNGHLRDRGTLERELDALASRYSSEH